MASTRERIGQILLSRRLITQAQLDQALKMQESNKEPLGEILLRCGYVSEEMLVRALAAQMGVQPWNLKSDAPHPDALKLVTIEKCQELEVLPVQTRGDLLFLAMRNPRNTAVIEQVRDMTGMRVEPVLAYEPRLLRLISQIGESFLDTHEMDVLVMKAMREVDGSAGMNRLTSELSNEVDTRPVVGLVNQLLADAIRRGASDVHIEPREKEVDIRFRIDGRLVLVDSFPTELMPMVMTRIKIMAEVDIVEFRVPQDGRVSVRLDGRNIDMRVSVLPNYHGPKVVLRLHDRTAALRPLTDLGFSEPVRHGISKLLKKPYGMVLVTGPTGSGKTTTLYAALNEIVDESINIMTVEDPIEFDLKGINQSQVNEKVGLTFAEQLRAILRQDPDVVLVGEIRDHETADIALRASMTGHLLLSTLHANDALAAIPRLVDIGLDRSLLSTSLIGVLAQRLVRKLCSSCKVEALASEEEIEVLSQVLGHCPPQLFKPSGCPACSGTGYRGRVAIGELLTVDRDIAEMIAAGVPLQKIRRRALKSGFVPFKVDAAERIISGETSYEEVTRAVFFDDDQESDYIGLAA